MRVCAVNGTNVRAERRARRARAGRTSPSPARRCCALRASRRPATRAARRRRARCSVDARRRDERRRLAVAERDRAGLVEQQHVDVAGRLDRAAGRRDHVRLDHAVHAGDADRRQQPADRGRDQADQQRDQHRDRDRRALARRSARCRCENGSSVTRREQEDDRQRRRAGCRARSRSASSGAWRPRPSRSCGRGRSRRGWRVMRTTSQSDSTRVPPVTALRSPPLSRITGALSPVIALSSTEATPSIDLAVARDDVAGLDQHDVALAQRRADGDRVVRVASRRGSASFFAVHVACAPCAASRPAPCRGLRPSPRRSWRTAR